MRSNFQIDGTITIVAGEAYFDLHNCFDFVGFEYRPTERSARLEWCRSVGEWVSKDLPVKLILRFEDTMNFAVKGRDPEMPFTEDDCLANISFLPPELGDGFEELCPGFRCDDEHLLFQFQSGAGIKVWAMRVTLEVE